jgi:thioredoxin 1
MNLSKIDWLWRTPLLCSNFRGDEMGMPVLMDFSAQWCGPCRVMAPTMIELEAEYEGKAEIKTIDVDKEAKLASKYGIFVVPTLILVKDGAELKRWMGITSKEELMRALNRALK